MTSAADLAALAQQFVAAQLAGDRRAAIALIDAQARAGVRVVDLQAGVIRAAQEEIGRRWQANEISVAQEHLATGISQLALAKLFDYAAPTAGNGRRVFVACVQGELHDLPARLVADYLDHGGFAVRYFGPDVPTHDLLGAISIEPPHLLALSVTMSFNVAALRALVPQVRRLAPVLPIAIGGHAVRWASTLAHDLGVDTAPSDPDSLLALARRLTGVS